MKVKIKKLHKDAILPSYGKEGDACLDLTAISKVKNSEDEDQYLYTEYETGISFEIPKGFVGLLFPRSSITNKTMMLKNSVGIIDPTYRGSIKFRFIEQGDNSYAIGDRIGQIMILPFPEIELELVEELSDTIRKDGGFGSTGK